MTSPLSANPGALEPASVWRLFAEMTQVPRPSKKEARVRAHVRAQAQALGWETQEDDAGNLVIRVPAKPGHENAPITVLQGHLDMVCEKNNDTAHDFDHDPIKALVTEDENGEPIVKADGTTLGADNGIGVCMALAAASSPDVVHGPLEILLTIDEEAGMSGAKALQPGFIQGRRLLNLDSEEDDVIYIGCAGGCDTNLSWDLPTHPLEDGVEVRRVAVSGLRGGHSGCDIHENRANAIKVLAQTLRPALAEGARLVRITGGRIRNAIPREAEALVAGPLELLKKLHETAEPIQTRIRDGYKEANAEIQIEHRKGSSPFQALSSVDSELVLGVLTALPNGVLAVVPEIPGLVQTSNNVSTVAWTSSGAGSVRIEIGCLSRSSSRTRMEAALAQIHAVGRLGGAAIQSGNDYPGWQPNPDSRLLATCRRIYEELFQSKPNVTAIHAGLECGILGERVGGDIDMVSFGPCIKGAHSPDERVYVKSVRKSWNYLKAVLAELSKG